ncbi:chromodomain-helicase-DNA-binding protein 7 [Caerostris extrusa]|uniref:Chromodomain-helicase-DNA-binding protein 7 n=1 Tax=Caerostris extrusa TaxID=172846 RepID=A0AAV4RFS8_CAEEX|nr:chromodomain-helicase-DNA-binding protein 7 [Caerostris extrusa]
MAGQYVSGGPRLHHLSDPMSSIPDQSQQASPRTVVPGQMYQNRNMASSHYSQQIQHNAAGSQMTQGSSQYPSHYSNVQHHTMQQHAVQQVNQNTDMWQNSMPHSQMTRPCMPASQNYSQHQMVPGQHSTASLNRNPMAMQGQRSSTPNQSQYMTNQEYTAPHATNQQSSMQRPPVYNMNSTSVNQNGSMGHYVGSQTTTNRPHYNAATAVGSSVGLPSQQHVVGQQMMNVRPPVHQMGYTSVSTRVNSGQQHTNSVPPGSPARLQQYHPPFSPNQTYSAPQPSPRPTNPETATPPHLHYSNSQPHTQAPMSPQYRNPFPSQVTRSPQHLTPTPPTEVSVPPPLTPERVLSSTPQSQGSYHSPSTSHLTSPGQGHSPGNSNAPSSLQHLEQMVLPRASTGPSTTPTASSVSPSGPTAGMSHNSGASGNYYGHLSNAQLPQQHQMHHPPVGDARPQPQSPAFSHISQQHSHHTYLNQPHSVGQLPSPTVSSVPNSQPLQPNISTISTLSNSSLLSEESMPIESSQHSIMSYGSDNSSSIPSVSVTETNVSRSATTNVGSLSTPDQIAQVSCASSASSDSVLPSSHQYNILGKGPYQGNSSSVTYEMQQIQQELQQLYGIHQSPETHEKVKALQERLRYLQTQQNNVRNTAPYGHQSMIQPQTVHYNPQTQQASAAQEVAIPPTQINMNAATLNTTTPPDSIQNIPEPISFDSESMAPNHYPASGSEIMPTLSLQDQPSVPPRSL